MMRAFSLVAACVAAALPAAGQVSVVDGFDSSTGWSALFLNNIGDAFIQTSGGNPGGYADLRPQLQQNTRAGAGYYRSFLVFSIGSLSDVTLSADYRWISGQPLTLVPFLTQENRVYLPSSAIALGTQTAWTSVGPMTFPLSTFSNSSGIPLHPQAQTWIGFFALIISPTPVVASARVGIDNLNLQVVPAPASGVVFGGVVVRGWRRRRVPLETSPLPQR
jgi:hypothetical protein